jgi:PAS domain S-box-containing protein
MKLRALDQREAVISAAMDAIVLLDSNERIVLFNPAAEQMFDVPASAVFGQTLDQFLPERLKGCPAADAASLRENGSPSRLEAQPREMRGVRTNSEEFPLEASVSQIHVAGESFCVIILRDITRRKQAEAALVKSQQEEHSRRVELETLMEALRQSELRLRFATDATGLGVFDFEPQTGRLIWSDLAKLHFGLPPEAEVDYETFLRGLHPEDRSRMADIVEDVLRLENGGH